MNLLSWIIAYCLLGGVVSILAAASVLLLPERVRRRVLPHGISFAIGALLAVSLTGLLPEAMHSVQPEAIAGISWTVLAGVLVFFLLEKLLIWRHCHANDCEAHLPQDEEHLHNHDHGHSKAGSLILVGDAIHNFVDGILIAAAFLTDFHLGVVTAIAVTVHEIPQEVGDFAILLSSGYSRRRAFLYNLIVSLSTVLGGILGYYSLAELERFLPYILSLAAGSFIYIAVADLIPTLHRRVGARATVQQVSLICAGLLMITAMHELMPH